MGKSQENYDKDHIRKVSLEFEVNALSSIELLEEFFLSLPITLHIEERDKSFCPGPSALHLLGLI